MNILLTMTELSILASHLTNVGTRPKISEISHLTYRNDLGIYEI